MDFEPGWAILAGLVGGVVMAAMLYVPELEQRPFDVRHDDLRRIRPRFHSDRHRFSRRARCAAGVNKKGGFGLSLSALPPEATCARWASLGRSIRFRRSPRP